MSEVFYCPTDEDSFDDFQDAMEFVGNIAHNRHDALGWVIDVHKKDHPLHNRFIDARDLINDMQNKASDEFSEYADDYLSDVEFDEEKIKSLSALLEEWFDKNADHPTFYQSAGKVDSIIVDSNLLDKHGITF